MNIYWSVTPAKQVEKFGVFLRDINKELVIRMLCIGPLAIGVIWWRTKHES